MDGRSITEGVDTNPGATVTSGAVRIPAAGAVLHGRLGVPEGATGLVIAGHTDGPERMTALCRQLQEDGLGTLLLDLRPSAEGAGELASDEHLVDELVEASLWVARRSDVGYLRTGLFGEGVVAGATLVAAARMGAHVGAVVAGDPRIDPDERVISQIVSPTLLLVSDDARRADFEATGAKLRCERALQHVSDDPEATVRLASQWFRRNLV